MAEQDWLIPATAPPPSPYQNVVESPGMGVPIYELRPLSLGELLDRTFSLYRSHFWLFAGIAAMSGAISLVVNIAQALLQHFFWRHSSTAVASIGRGAIMFVILAIYFLAYSVTQAATVFALSEVYLGKLVTIGGSFGATVSRWYVYAAIAIWQWWSLVWLPLVLLVPALMAMLFAAKAPASSIIGGLLLFLGLTAGIVGGVILFLRNALAIQATVVERLKIRASMRRSKDLSSGAKGRMVVVGLISMAMYMVFGVMQVPLLFVVAAASRRGSEPIGAQAAMFLINFLGHMLVSPVALIGLSLVYFDQRVRKEAFDIAVLLGEPEAKVLSLGTHEGFAAPYGDAAPQQEPWKSETQAPDDSAV
jgi:hypothetical protein